MTEVRIVAISDQHGNLPEIPECDLLLIAGDVCPSTNHSLPFQSLWLNTEFKDWLKEVPAKKIVGVAGNHDFIFQERPDEVTIMGYDVYIEIRNNPVPMLIGIGIVVWFSAAFYLIVGGRDD